MHKSFSRRRLLALSGATLLLPAVARAAEPVRHNVSGFAQQDWRDHFSELGQGAIVCDTLSRALHF